MEPMILFNSTKELQESHEKYNRMSLDSQQVYSGKIFGCQDCSDTRNFSVENSSRQTDVERHEKKANRKSEEAKKPKMKTKQSLYSVICDELLQKHILIRDEVRNVYYFEDGIYHKADSILLAEYIKKNLSDVYVRQVSDPGFYNKLLTDLKSDYRIEVVDRKKLDNRLKHLVAFQNGVYDCWQGKFLNFSPEFYLFSKLEVEYCRNARADVFGKFLNSVSGGDAAIRNLIWQMIAYILLPTNDGKCFFVMGTAPNSGKSLLAKVIEAMFSDSAVNRSPIAAISGRFGLASMADKRINIAPECVDERISPEVINNIKLLTGEESINIERKGIDASREYTICKLLIATNCATAFAVKDSAFWNRMRIIPFQYSIPQNNQRTDLFEDLKLELDYIASIAVSKYAGALIESNYQFTVPDVSARLMCQWRNSSLDILKQFLECKCAVTNDSSDFIPVNELYEEYCRWLKHLHRYTEPLAIRDFSRKIRERFTQCVEPREKEKIADKYVRVLHGICWLEDFDTD